MLSSEAPAPPPLRTRRGAGERLREAVLRLAGPHGVLARHSHKNWASITFAGARHRLELVFDGAEAVEAGDLFVAALADHEFTISGQLVAEAAVVAVDHRLHPARLQVTCEILLLEDA